MTTNQLEIESIISDYFLINEFNKTEYDNDNMKFEIEFSKVNLFEIIKMIQFEWFQYNHSIVAIPPTDEEMVIEIHLDLDEVNLFFKLV